MLPNIGLAGRAGSGKGVLAAELVKRGYEVVSFATGVKVGAARAVYGASISEELALRLVATQKDTFRPLLQAYGVAVRQLFHEAIWIDQALNRAVALGQPVVIDDVRFPNEVAALKAAGFVTVRIERPHWHRTLYGGNTLTGAQAQHRSEAQIDDLDVDLCLDNQTTPATLLRKLDHHLRGLNG